MGIDSQPIPEQFDTEPIPLQEALRPIIDDLASSPRVPDYPEPEPKAIIISPIDELTQQIDRVHDEYMGMSPGEHKTAKLREIDALRERKFWLEEETRNNLPDDPLV